MLECFKMRQRPRVLEDFSSNWEHGEVKRNSRRDNKRLLRARGTSRFSFGVLFQSRGKVCHIAQLFSSIFTCPSSIERQERDVEERLPVEWRHAFPQTRLLRSSSGNHWTGSNRQYTRSPTAWPSRPVRPVWPDCRFWLIWTADRRYCRHFRIIHLYSTFMCFPEHLHWIQSIPLPYPSGSKKDGYRKKNEWRCKIERGIFWHGLTIYK